MGRGDSRNPSVSLSRCRMGRAERSAAKPIVFAGPDDDGFRSADAPFYPSYADYVGLFTKLVKNCINEPLAKINPLLFHSFKNGLIAGISPICLAESEYQLIQKHSDWRDSATFLPVSSSINTSRACRSKANAITSASPRSSVGSSRRTRCWIVGLNRDPLFL